MKKIYRQGDVLLVPVDEVPESAKRINPKRAVLAEGEVSLFQDKAEVIFTQIMEATELRHAEHATQTIEPGIYRIVRQREYTPQEIRRVAD